MSTKLNQLFVPQQNIQESDFVFFNKGRELWNLSLQFKDDIEDTIRNQLEVSDNLQGFMVTADTNSGFGSLSNQVITYYLKDQSPKTPVYLFSINNSNKVIMDENMSEEERTNAKMRQSLMDLNTSLFMSEIQENVEIIVPFDSISIGKKQKEYMGNYNKELLFHQTSL
jgi:hypothetical protein